MNKVCYYCQSPYDGWGLDYTIFPCGNGDLGVRAQCHATEDPHIVLYKDKALASGYFKINYCPICGRKLEKECATME